MNSESKDKGIQKAKIEAEQRWKQLCDNPAKLIGDWLYVLEFNRDSVFLKCPVCDAYLPWYEVPDLDISEWHVKENTGEVIITGYSCPNCDYILPCIPDTTSPHSLHDLPELIQRAIPIPTEG